MRLWAAKPPTEIADHSLDEHTRKHHRRPWRWSVFPAGHRADGRRHRLIRIPIRATVQTSNRTHIMIRNRVGASWIHTVTAFFGRERRPLRTFILVAHRTDIVEIVRARLDAAAVSAGVREFGPHASRGRALRAPSSRRRINARIREGDAPGCTTRGGVTDVTIFQVKADAIPRIRVHAKAGDQRDAQDSQQESRLGASAHVLPPKKSQEGFRNTPNGILITSSSGSSVSRMTSPETLSLGVSVNRTRSLWQSDEGGPVTTHSTSGRVACWLRTVKGLPSCRRSVTSCCN